MQVHLQNRHPVLYQGHRVKVKVTGAEKRLCVCVSQAFTN